MLFRSLPLALTYGMSESTSQAATAAPALTRAKPGTVGPPIDGVEIAVDDTGEVLVRGATVAAGYLGEPLSLTREGWLRTGDLGEIDPDGDLHTGTPSEAERVAHDIAQGIRVPLATPEHRLLTPGSGIASGLGSHPASLAPFCPEQAV